MAANLRVNPELSVSEFKPAAHLELFASLCMYELPRPQHSAHAHHCLWKKKVTIHNVATLYYWQVAAKQKREAERQDAVELKGFEVSD